MDLTRDVPRSPYASLGGIVFLPRAIDKARADAAGTLGEYMSRHGFRWICSSFSASTSTAFTRR